MAKETKGTKKVSELSPKAKEVLELLQSSGTEMTLKEIESAGIEKPNGSHLKALENRGLVSSRDVDVIVEQTRTVKTYSIVAPTKTE